MFNWRYTIAILGGVLFDHWTKYIARTELMMGNSIVVIPKLLNFDLVFNKGAAYGLLSNYPNVLSGFALTVIALAFLFQRHFSETIWTRIGLTAVIMGAIGNVSDRLLFGKVTDMFNIHIIPVFNMADIFINIGVLCFIIDFILTKKRIEAK